MHIEITYKDEDTGRIWGKTCSTIKTYREVIQKVHRNQKAEVESAKKLLEFQKAHTKCIKQNMHRNPRYSA
jgi:hypothetical protein